MAAAMAAALDDTPAAGASALKAAVRRHAIIEVQVLGSASHGSHAQLTVGILRSEVEVVRAQPMMAQIEALRSQTLSALTILVTLWRLGFTGGAPRCSKATCGWRPRGIAADCAAGAAVQPKGPPKAEPCA